MAMSEEKSPYPSRTADQFVVRFPDGMRDALKEEAHANGRSMNAEIVARLQQSFEPTIRQHQSSVSLADPEALQQQLDTALKSLRLHENAMLVMHGLLRAVLREIPPEMDDSTTLQIIKSFLRASDEQNMEQARKAWDALMSAADPTVLLASKSSPIKAD